MKGNLSGKVIAHKNVVVLLVVAMCGVILLFAALTPLSEPRIPDQMGKSRPFGLIIFHDWR